MIQPIFGSIEPIGNVPVFISPARETLLKQTPEEDSVVIHRKVKKRSRIERTVSRILRMPIVRGASGIGAFISLWNVFSIPSERPVRNAAKITDQAEKVVAIVCQNTLEKPIDAKKIPDTALPAIIEFDQNLEDQVADTRRDSETKKTIWANAIRLNDENNKPLIKTAFAEAYNQDRLNDVTVFPVEGAQHLFTNEGYATFKQATKRFDAEYKEKMSGLYLYGFGTIGLGGLFILSLPKKFRNHLRLKSE